jgi:Tfp pilus assembly protein PilF
MTAKLRDAYDALINEAREAIRARDLARAERLAREALGHTPERAAAYNILAVVRELEGLRIDAMNLLRAAISVEPTYRPAEENLTRLGTRPHHSRAVLGDEED